MPDAGDLFCCCGDLRRAAHSIAFMRLGEAIPFATGFYDANAPGSNVRYSTITFYLSAGRGARLSIPPNAGLLASPTGVYVSGLDPFSGPRFSDPVDIFSEFNRVRAIMDGWSVDYPIPIPDPELNQFNRIYAPNGALVDASWSAGAQTWAGVAFNSRTYTRGVIVTDGVSSTGFSGLMIAQASIAGARARRMSTFIIGQPDCVITYRAARGAFTGQLQAVLQCEPRQTVPMTLEIPWDHLMAETPSIPLNYLSSPFIRQMKGRGEPRLDLGSPVDLNCCEF